MHCQSMYQIGILMSALTLSGCAYRTQIYAPEAIRAEDHVQGSALFVHRDSLAVQLNVSRDKNTLRLSMVFTDAEPSARFASMDFSVEANDQVFRPKVPPEVYSSPGHSRGHAPLAITANEWLVVEFDIGAGDLSNFRLHLPSIAVGETTVPDMDVLMISKKRVWRAISPL